MKVLILGGAGKIGSAVAWDLVSRPEVTEVGLADRSHRALERVRAWVNSPKITLHRLDLTAEESSKRLMHRYDVGVIALPDRKTSYRAIELAIDTGLNMVDILEEYHRRPDKHETEDLTANLVVPENMPVEQFLDEYGESLHTKAVAQGVTILDGMGFAPGLSNVTLGEAIRKLDQTETAIARVGGVPDKVAAQRHPLKYMITWAFGHVLREYVVKVNVRKGGQLVEVDAMTDWEPFRFTEFGVDEALECAITPGMPSFIYTRPELQEFAEKTIRWPGHWQGIAFLKECGMLDLEPVTLTGPVKGLLMEMTVKVAPREVLSAALTPRLEPREGDTDICVMWSTATGVKAGRRTRIDYYLWDKADTQNNISSMARVTGFTAAVSAVLLGRGEITAKGIVAPEDGITGAAYQHLLAELEQKGIVIREIVRPID